MELGAYSFKIPRRAEQIGLKILAAFFPNLVTKIQSAREYIFSLAHLPPEPDKFTDPTPSNIEGFDRAITNNRNLLVTGKSGVGKTTFALQMRRRCLEAKGKPLASKIPVFVRVPASRLYKNPRSLMLDLVGQSVASKSPLYRKGVAWSMLRGSSLLLILDDVDSMSPTGLAQLEEFMSSQRRHSFLCVRRERPETAFWNDFEVLTMREWDKSEASEYIKCRIKEDYRRNDVIKHIDTAHLFDHKLTALQWGCLLDTYLAGRVFEIFYPKLESGWGAFRIQNAYLKILIQNAGIDYMDCVRTVGALALQLAMRGRRSFSTKEAQFEPSYFKKLSPNLFTGERNEFAFVDGPYQSLMAGSYIGQCWASAKKMLDDSRATELVWSPIYNCASRYCDGSDALDIYRTFQKLAVAEMDAKSSGLTINRVKNQPRNSRKSPQHSTSDPAVPPVDYDMLQTSTRLLVEKSHIDYEIAVKELGRFSLSLIVQARLAFTSEETQKMLSKAIWEKVRPSRQIKVTSDLLRDDRKFGLQSDIFIEHDHILSFIHNNHQVSLAAQYILAFWPEAQEILRQAKDSNPEFNDIYLFARTKIPAERRFSFEYLFRPLVGLENLDRMLPPTSGHKCWDALASQRFELLLRLHAYNLLLPREINEFEELSLLRTESLCPRLPEEEAADATQEATLAKIVDEIQGYAQTITGPEGATS